MFINFFTWGQRQKNKRTPYEREHNPHTVKVSRMGRNLLGCHHSLIVVPGLQGHGFHFSEISAALFAIPLHPAAVARSATLWRPAAWAVWSECQESRPSGSNGRAEAVAEEGKVGKKIM